MKQYTSRELSEKLVKLGCKSQSRMHYYRHTPLDRERLSLEDQYFLSCPSLSKIVRYSEEGVESFEFEDFCGTHQQAKENLRCITKEAREISGYNLLFKSVVIQTLSVKEYNNLKNKSGVEYLPFYEGQDETKKTKELKFKLINSKDWLKELEKVMEERAA